MQLTLAPAALAEYLAKQLNHLYPDGQEVRAADLMPHMDLALQRLEFCFSRIKIRHYNQAGTGTKFNHLFADQYILWLWFLANTIHRQDGNPTLATKIYLLNKSLHAFDAMYDTHLPDIFMVVHGVGTVLGKAEYADFFVVYQGCTIGNNHGIYPKLGKGLGLGASASVVGACEVGEYVSVGIGTHVLDMSLPEQSVAYRNTDGKLEVRPHQAGKSLASEYFLAEFLYAK